MVIWTDNDSENIFIRTGLFIRLNDPYVLNESYVNNASLVVVISIRVFW